MGEYMRKSRQTNTAICSNNVKDLDRRKHQVKEVIALCVLG